MKEVRYTLVSDGSSDQALLPILTWMLRLYLPDVAIQPNWANPLRFPRPPEQLADKIGMALEFFPCDLLFVHRDAERGSREERVYEITEAIAKLAAAENPPFVCVVPVRMMEAWLLHDEAALRKAAGKPTGGSSLEMPIIRRLEEEPDPKALLHALLRTASGYSGRRLKKFVVSERVQRLANRIEDFSRLRALPAFQAMQAELMSVISEQDW